MINVQKAGVAIIILLESLLFGYAPEITKRFASYRGVWINEKNLDNATSGALLSLALTHLLPEGFSEEGEVLKLGCIDLRGFIMGMPIFLLVTIDFLAGHHCGSNFVVDSHVKSLNCSALEANIRQGIEHNHTSHVHLTLSNLSTESGCKDRECSKIDTLGVRLKQLFTSRALYLLLTFYSHSILEGALLGTEKNTGGLWGMAFGIFAHKWAECIVLNTTVTNLIQKKALRHFCTVAFALCVPLGILLGSLISKQCGALQATFQLLAIGFFLYLSFELLTHHGSEADNTEDFPLWVSYFLGVVTMAGILAVVEVVEHSSQKKD
ncbi:hypothetical protein BgAZ_404780 [Babesia gibsoni]|uniref:Uncharacterized protein n=1 Tax=Babesia gibsoni TaxID=33632 RepID=A0AAD8LN36_BABGI|nr:hypothetical protein BgAZ_404780 [Babesia gibsoni]